jgi:hypothetical protein
MADKSYQTHHSKRIVPTLLVEIRAVDRFMVEDEAPTAGDAPKSTSPATGDATDHSGAGGGDE